MDTQHESILVWQVRDRGRRLERLGKALRKEEAFNFGAFCMMPQAMAFFEKEKKELLLCQLK